MDSLPVVMGIAIPQRVQALPRSPPTCLPCQGDISAVEYLEAFGTRISVNQHEITQACNLASGLSDVVIILERPHDGNYNVPFETFVQTCKSLQALDTIIRFTTKGARSIHTTTVLDAFSYQKYKANTTFDRDCHQLLARILRIKKPKVVIRCHRDKYRDGWMGRFELDVDKYRLHRKEVGFSDGHKTILIQSFHPSCAVNNTDYRPEYKALLIHHFIAAFAELHSKHELPEFVEPIREMCLKKGQRKDMPTHRPWEAALLISETLKTGYTGPRPKDLYPVEFADDEPIDTFGHRQHHFSNMYHWLRCLAGGFCTCGTLAIARVMTYWEYNFKDDPLFEQVKVLLGSSSHSSEQLEWLSVPTAENSPSKLLSLEGRLSELSVSPLEPRQTLVEWSRQAGELPPTVLTLFCEGELPGDMTSSTRIKLVGLINQQNELVKECLRHSSVTDFARTVQVAKHLRLWDAYNEVMAASSSCEDPQLVRIFPMLTVPVYHCMRCQGR